MEESKKLKIFGCIDIIVGIICTVLLFWGMPKNPWWFWMLFPACIAFVNAVGHFKGEKMFESYFEDEER